MSGESISDGADVPRRGVIQAAGFAVMGGLLANGMSPANAAPATSATKSAARNNGPLGARLQGVQHFGLTVQDMERAFEFYTEVLGGTEVMRDGDFQGERIHNTQ